MMKWMRAVLPLFMLLTLTTACATTTTRLAPVDAALVRAEEIRQRELAMRTTAEQHTRLERVAWPILVAGRDLCKQPVPRYGLRWATIHSYENDWKPTARVVHSLGDTLTVIGVAPGSPADSAGIIPGDRVLSAASFTAVTGKQATAEFNDYLESRRSDTTSLKLHLLRDGEPVIAEVAPVLACPDALSVVQDGSINAFADGKAIYVTTAMMRFADDHELAVIVGHELAHNGMGHIDAKRSNALAAGIFGLIADVAMATQGVNTGGAYTSQFAQLGAMTFSQDFEREADYVGLYVMARAGLPLDDAPTLWRHMAIAHPGSIQLATSHPTTAERFVRLEQAIVEIREKQARGLPLLPEMKGEPDRRRE